MALSRQDNPALLLVDIQQGFDDIAYWGGQRNNLDAETKASELLNLWREKGLPVFHVQHSSTTLVSRLHPSHPGHAFKEIVKPRPDEPVIQKNVNSAFIGTDLKERLDKANIKTLVIVGLTTDHCISTTTRMAGNFGYETFLVSDATATFAKKGVDGQEYPAELIHATALASLNDEFATVVTTEAVTQRI